MAQTKVVKAVRATADGANLETIYDTYFSKIYNYFFYRLLHRETAEDLTSQTFLRAAERFHTYDPSRPIGPWLFRVAERSLADYYREHRPVLSLEDEGMVEPSVSFEAEYQRILDPRRKALYAALAQLPQRDRTILYRKYILGESYHQIAQELSLGESTLASALQRAKEKLRRQLEQAGLEEYAAQP